MLAPIVINIGGVWSMDSLDDEQLQLGGHDQFNITWGLSVHVDLTLWITDTLSVGFIRYYD